MLKLLTNQRVQVAQAAVAVLPLFYTLDKGVDSNSITFSNDLVNVPNLDCYRRNNESTCPTLLGVVPSVSHSMRFSTYGRMIALICLQAFGEAGAAPDGGCPYANDSQINSGSQNCLYFRNNVTIGEYALRFTESNPDDTSNNYPNLGAGRIVKISAEGCAAIHPEELSTVSSDLDGEADEWSWRFDNATEKDLTLTYVREILLCACSKSNRTEISIPLSEI